jgi:hypothetical protein
LDREGLAFATIARYNGDVTKKPADASASGFTEFDLATLNEYSALQLAERRWSRANIVHGPFADVLAGWHLDGAGAEQLHLIIARFRRTGTYALTVGSQVVATASTLERILPARAGSGAMPKTIA